MDLQTHTDVCIIGAGPSGLALANELKRYGIPFELIERRTERTVHSKAFALHARSLEVFRRMGVADKLLARGLPVDGMAAYAGKRCVLGGDLSIIDSEFPFVLSIPQADTEAVLLEHLQENGGDVQWGQSLHDFKQNDDHVDVQLRDEQGALKNVRCKWLVGCDGAHSQVRQKMNVNWQGDDYDFEFLVADGKIDWAGDHSSGHTFLNQQGYVMLFPLPQQRHRIVINVDVNRYGSEQLNESLVNQILQERNLGDVHFHSPFWLSSTQGRRRIASDYKKGRVLLAGDAAHVHSPLGGQGLNTGIQDAYQLAWRLSAVQYSNDADHPLLKAYSLERRRIAQDVLNNTDQLTRLFTTRSPAARFLRRWVLPVISRRPKFAKKVAETASGIGIRLTQPYEDWHGDMDADVEGTRLMHASIINAKTNESVLAGNVLARSGYELVLMLGKVQSTAFYEAKRCLAQLQYDEKDRVIAPLLQGCSVISNPSTKASVNAWPEGFTFTHYHDPSEIMLRHYNVADAHYLIVRPDGYIACGGVLTEAEDVLHNLRTVLNPTRTTPPTASHTSIIPAQLAEV